MKLSDRTSVVRIEVWVSVVPGVGYPFDLPDPVPIAEVVPTIRCPEMQ